MVRQGTDKPFINLNQKAGLKVLIRPSDLYYPTGLRSLSAFWKVANH